MDARLNRISLAWGVPGLIVQLAGYIIFESAQDPLIALPAYLAVLIGTALLIVGLSYYAKAKGQHPVWCLLGFLSCIGLIGLALLKDKARADAAGPAAAQPPPPPQAEPPPPPAPPHEDQV